MSTTNLNRKKAREAFKTTGEKIRNLQDEVTSDLHVLQKDKNQVIDSLSEESKILKKQKSFTGYRGVVFNLCPNSLLPREVELEHAAVAYSKANVEIIEEQWQSLSEGARQRALESQRDGASDSSPAVNSPTSSIPTKDLISARIYNVTDSVVSVNPIPGSGQSAPPNAASDQKLEDELTQLLRRASVQVDVRSVAESSEGNSRRHRNYTSRSMYSDMSVPPREPSIVESLLPLPPPPRRRRIKVKTEVAGGVDSSPSSTEDELEEEPDDPEQLYRDNQSVNMPQESFSQAGHQVTHTSFLSMESSEEGHSFENADANSNQ